MQRTSRSARPRPIKRDEPSPKRKKAANAAIIGASALLIAGIGVTVVQDQRAEAQNAESVITYTPATTYTPPTVPDTALFIGDSYTAGVGAEDKVQRWTALVAREMGWLEANYGLGGTGYATTAGRNGCGRAECPTYPDRLAESEGQVAPEFIIIAGGQNDFAAYGDNPGKVTQAIGDTFTEAAAAYPDAEIIAVGPSTPWEISDTAEGIDEAVRDAAQSVDATYVSLLDPPVIEDDMVLEDGGHVGPDGHAAIAERVLSTLKN